MADSILNDIKKALGITEDYTAFDQEIILHTNTALMFAEEIGLPSFKITGKTETWDHYLSGIAKNVEAVKTYLYLQVRLVFDPPANSFVVTAIEKQLQEYAWRINLQKETP